MKILDFRRLFIVYIYNARGPPAPPSPRRRGRGGGRWGWGAWRWPSAAARTAPHPPRTLQPAPIIRYTHSLIIISCNWPCTSTAQYTYTYLDKNLTDANYLHTTYNITASLTKRFFSRFLAICNIWTVLFHLQLLQWTLTKAIKFSLHLTFSEEIF